MKFCGAEGADAAAVTVTTQVAVLLPSVVVTVIVAVPTAFAVTRPDADTVATVELLVVHVTALFVALLGATVAVSCIVALTVIEALVGLTVTPVTGTFVVVTHLEYNVAVAVALSHEFADTPALV